MNRIPTTSDLAHLGQQIHDQGFGPHENQLAEISRLGLSVRPKFSALEVLGDKAHTEIVRARALARVSAEWDSIADQLRTKSQPVSKPSLVDRFKPRRRPVVMTPVVSADIVRDIEAFHQRGGLAPSSLR